LWDEFVPRFVAAAKELKLSAALDYSGDMGSLISEKQLNTVANHVDDVLRLMKKYSNVPMSFADACLVRMSEVLPNPTILATDSDFHVYRRHGRRAIPCVTPR